MSGILIMGLSHKTAPIELRERLTIPAHRLADSLDQLRKGGDLQEAVVLSTCNRLEVYARPVQNSEHGFSLIKNFFLALYSEPKLEEALYRFESMEAIQHLFRVASGLDSMVVGETDVLGQVKAAYAFAQNHGTTGKITNVLFQRALFVGKTVRTNTGISEGASSVGSIAVQLAERIFGQLSDHRILLLGAGKIAEITARHLLSQKAGHLMILNRTQAKAEEMARQLNGSAGPMDALEEELLKADIVICSTAADKPLVTKEMIPSIMKKRKMRSLYFIDIAVPRNVEASVHEVDNVYVYNIDDLKSFVEENLSNRKKELVSAETLVNTMAEEFHEWLKATLAGQSRPLRHQINPDLPRP